LNEFLLVSMDVGTLPAGCVPPPPVPPVVVPALPPLSLSSSPLQAARKAMLATPRPATPRKPRRVRAPAIRWLVAWSARMRNFSSAMVWVLLLLDDSCR
jgi:hypothetical protein